MPNPGRPQYQDIIDEAWGDQVADRVVRRYVDDVERDADLAGFTPAELAGQLVAIVPAAPASPYLQRHDGALWRGEPAAIDGAPGVGLIVKVAANAWCTSSDIGFATCLFAEPFPNACLGVVPSSCQGSDSSEWLTMLHPEYTNKSQFVFVPRTWNGGGHPGGDFAVSYVAWGN
jgi:hypothetical protein